MAKFYSGLTPELGAFIDAQEVFFVATAPRGGRINLSPKGLDTFRRLDERRVAYLDLTGSGNETAAHLLDNGRITLMFCSFDRKPLILRLYGHGRAVQPRDPEWNNLRQHFPDYPGARQIMAIDVDSVQTSCGYGVPVFGPPQERETLNDWARQKGDTDLEQYRREKNRTSIDGLPCEGQPD